MRRLSPIAALVLAAFSVPLAVELRTVAGFFGVELSTTTVVLFEVIVLALIFVAYTLGQMQTDGEDESAS